MRTVEQWAVILRGNDAPQAADRILHDIVGYPMRHSRAGRLHWDNDVAQLANALRAWAMGEKYG